MLRLNVSLCDRVVVDYAVTERDIGYPDDVCLHCLGYAFGYDRTDLEKRDLFVRDPKPCGKVKSVVIPESFNERAERRSVEKLRLPSCARDHAARAGEILPVAGGVGEIVVNDDDLLDVTVFEIELFKNI